MNNIEHILITGSTGKLGKTICEVYAEMGVNIILHYFDSDKKINLISEDIKKKFPKISIIKIKIDLSKLYSVSYFNKNLFTQNSSKSGISKDGEFFTAGLLKHVTDFMIISNQWVNSYKRLVSKNESPSHISWSNTPNNFNLITIPKIREGSEDSSRIEFRLPDPGCNPYLTFASIITAGLNGMKNKYKLEKPTLN